MRKYVVDPVAGHVWEGGDPGEARGDASDRNNPWPRATVCIIHGCDDSIVVGVSPHCAPHGLERGHGVTKADVNIPAGQSVSVGNQSVFVTDGVPRGRR